MALVWRIATATVVVLLATLFAASMAGAQTATPTAGTGGILLGDAPTGSGFATFAFGGGSFEQLLEASGCPEATSTFFYNRPDGGFSVWVPGATIVEVNANILALFASGIPAGAIFSASCGGGLLGETPPPPPPVVQYYIASNGQQVGPFMLASMALLISGGHVRVDTLVWRPGLPVWAAAGTVPELQPLFRPAPAPPPQPV
jgi:hypothetical protein